MLPKIGDVRKNHTLTYLYNITYGFAKDSWGRSDITVNGVSSDYGAVYGGSTPEPHNSKSAKASMVKGVVRSKLLLLIEIK